MQDSYQANAWNDLTRVPDFVFIVYELLVLWEPSLGFPDKRMPSLNHVYSGAGFPSLSWHLSSTTVPLRAELGTSHDGTAGATEG